MIDRGIPPQDEWTDGDASFPLTAVEARAAAALIRRVRAVVPAELVWAVLFGSKARGEARPDSDVDLLFVFDDLPPDREPHATITEELAEQVSARVGFEVSAWSVSLLDLGRGMRTPMLVDALEDGLLLWPGSDHLPRPPFTVDDAVRCTGALLQRVEEGSEEAAELAHRGEVAGLARRMRDDVVRLCTALLLLHGETRPRRAEVARRLLEVSGSEPAGRRERVLKWVIESYGPSGRDDERAVRPPPVEMWEVAELIDRMREEVARGREALAARTAANARNGGARPREGTRPMCAPGMQAQGRWMEHHAAISA